MSKYSLEPIDLSGLKTISVHDRGGKVRVEDFARPFQAGGRILALLDSMPRLLAADSLRAVIEAILSAREKRKQIVWGLGGHVIKCGLAPVLGKLAEQGFATAFAMNGSAAIHDFEIAIAGHTSEDVEAVLPDGRFGSAEETGREMNTAIVEGDADHLGMGEALGRHLQAVAHASYREKSLLATSYGRLVPVTVHVAVGTDTPHTHPTTNPAALGSATHRDFRLFASLVAGLHDGGVYVNAGSAVVLPEVFLKALSAVRNLGHPLADFVTINLDFLQHYRPRVNVIERPHAGSGGNGYSITGHHEITIPLIAAILTECAAP